MSEKPVIELKDVSKSFGNLHVLKNISFKVERGETLAIIGGSGVGKSVTLKLIIGLFLPDSGEVLFDGSGWRGLFESQADKRRQRFGYVFQGGALFDSMSIYENVAFPLREHTKKKEPEIRDIVKECLLSVGLRDIEHKVPSELSGGMQKRVSLARAMAVNPEVLLFDEPTTGLDPLNSKMINKLIGQATHNPKITSVVVTHDIPGAMYVANKIIMIYRGEMIFYGTADELKENRMPQVRSFVTTAFGNYED